MRSNFRNIIGNKWVVAILLVIIVLLGAYFRFTGIKWDENYHLHPDERFLTMVETSIKPVSSLGEYFDTNTSTLNPHNNVDANGNQTYPFFVYGTFPIFLVRYVGEILNRTGYSEIFLVGRYLSGIFDLGTVLLIFFVAKLLFKKQGIALLSALMYACAALPIQISHYFIVDNFTTFFFMIAFYAAVRISIFENELPKTGANFSNRAIIFSEWRGFGMYLLFAIALGLAAASKINAVVAAFLLPAAVGFSVGKEYFKFTDDRWKVHLKFLIFAGLTSIIVFRIFQPYAFAGPGFFNFSLNEKWINNLKELGALSSGLSNYPPSLQWTRRTFLFPIKNMLLWGMGIPFGIASMVGLSLMTWKLIKGKSKQFGVLVSWTMTYLVWQTSRWNPTMRYFLLIYPTFALIAAWFINYLIKIIEEKIEKKPILLRFTQVVIVSVCIFTLVLWGFAFTNIYRQPMTRIAASEWIYRHLEGAINLQLDNGEEAFTQPIPYPRQYQLEPGTNLVFEFTPDEKMEISQILFDHIASLDPAYSLQQLTIDISEKGTHKLLIESIISDNFQPNGDSRGQEYRFDLASPVQLELGKVYLISVFSPQENSLLKFSGTVGVTYVSDQTEIQKRIFEFTQPLKIGEPFTFSFTPFEDGVLSGIEFFRVRTFDLVNKDISFSVEISDPTVKTILANSGLTTKLSTPADFRGQNVVIEFDAPVNIKQGTMYELTLRINDTSNSPILIYGSKTAKETDWDDALPLFMYGLNPFDTFSGVYQSDLNFQMYWDDNEEKLVRFTSILDQADYIIFSSNRQWGSLTQAPEKYPLSTYFYKQLIGCQLDDVQKCFIQAQPGDSLGGLGFSLGNVFDSEPEAFGMKVNSQNAEEAFSVYDHPKVFIFEKTDVFNFKNVLHDLSSIDLATVLNISPQELEKRPGSLLLPRSAYEKQKGSGTWSELFNYESVQNKYPFVSVVIWYLSIAALGWMVFPTVRIVFKGLKDKGFAISKLVGLIVLTFFVWMIGSSGISINTWIIWGCVFVIFVGNAALFYFQRKEILKEIKSSWKIWLMIEGISLLFFVIFLTIRLGNPDLWHPYKGGEKPMDFSYFNAVIKSIIYPPYDPWYSGGYINYYYWGFLLAAVPTKALGIVPSIAYNLILPSFFSFTAIGTFCVGMNFYRRSDLKFKRSIFGELVAGLTASIFVLIIGNLGTIKMIFQGFQRLANSVNPISTFNKLDGLKDFFVGIKVFITQGRFNYYPGDWYWIPSRAIPGQVITEFPFFTYLYGDPHAHLFALPITLLVIAWVISLVQQRMQYQHIREYYFSLLLGALIIGALRPTNTWDYPAFLMLAGIGILFAYIRYGHSPESVFQNLHNHHKRILIGIVITIGFASTSYFLFNPFSRWYGQGYSSVEFWKGDKTPIGSYLTHWGFFLFVITSWLINESIQWLKEIPLSYLKRIYLCKNVLLVICGLILSLTIWLIFIGVEVVIVTVPLLIILALHLFRKKYTDTQRLVVLLTAIGLGLTLVVELVVLTGDVGRMNTVFKFYLQAWTLLALSSSWFFSEVIQSAKQRVHKGFHSSWKTMLVLLCFSVCLFPVLASFDKVTDRISENVPLTLDGMEYMRYSTYVENGEAMDLSQDYELIRWIQENVGGTPTIIEANVPEYRWGNRVSIYTGLPGVIGWNWHQRQQRAINPSEWVYKRVEDVGNFYSAVDISDALSIINKYDVDYFVIGQLEKIIYPEAGLDKFFANTDDIFEICYSSQDTYLFRVKK